MLKEGLGFKRVIVCCGRTDLRKGIPGLTASVRLNYGLDTTEKGTLFLFCGNRADRIKGLLFEGDGQWPRTPDEARELTTEQFRRLMDGFAIEGTIKEVFTKQPNLENSIVQDKTVS